MLDWETPFADQSAAEDLLEGMIKHVLAAVLEHRRQELEILKRDVTALQRARIPDSFGSSCGMQLQF